MDTRLYSKIFFACVATTTFHNLCLVLIFQINQAFVHVMERIESSRIK